MACCGFVLCTSLFFHSSASRADDLQPLRNVGDGYKAVKIITRYEINAATKTMDLTATAPNDPSLSQDVRRQLAGQTARDICANRTIGPGWTIRIFIPGDSAPAASCKTGAPHGAVRRQG
jgi:hypothetical protein